MKSYRLESYKIGNEVRYFWTIEGKDGSTITLTLQEFQEMLNESQKLINEKINKNMSEDIFKNTEPNEALKKATEKYKEKYKEEIHPDSAYGQWMKRFNKEEK